MESAGVVVERWVKPLTCVDLCSDQMEIPKKIVIKYSHLFRSTFLLRFRNGYEIPIVYNATKGTLEGISTFYEDFGLKGLEFLIFEFDGCCNLNTYVIGTNLTEIEYPRVVHRMGAKRSRVVSVHNGGLRFVHFVEDEKPLCDELEPPISFKRACPMLRSFQEFVFSNGKKIVGHYNHGTGRFHGFRQFASILGLQNFAQFNLVLINYEEKWENTVSFFDDNFVEVFFSGTPLSTGYNLHNPIVRGKIEIVVQHCHMYKHSYGVDIPAQYVQLTTFWRKTEYINVYSGNSVWKLQVKSRRDNSRRNTINDGWIKFRHDLGLAEGDVVVLECADYSSRHFAMRVVKNITP